MELIQKYFPNLTDTQREQFSQLKALYEDGTVKDLCDKYADYGLSFDNWVLK